MFKYKFYFQDKRKKPYNIVSFTLQGRLTSRNWALCLTEIKYPLQNLDK